MSSIDPRDLGFDLGVHHEAIDVMIKSGLSEPSIVSILRARNVAFVELPGSRLSVGIGTDGALPRPSDGTSVKVIYSSPNASEVEKVRSDTEKYFLKHFPGRTTQNDLPSLEGPGQPCVYVVFRKAL